MLDSSWVLVAQLKCKCELSLMINAFILMYHFHLLYGVSFSAFVYDFGSRSFLRKKEKNVSSTCCFQDMCVGDLVNFSCHL